MSLQNPEDLSDDELERLQQQADGELEKPADPPSDAPDPEANDAVVDGEEGKNDEPEPEPTLEPATEKVVGVASKDGTRVLPYAALQAERRNARAASSRATRAEEELAAARQQIADLKAGKTATDELTEEEVAQMEEDFPEQGKKLRAVFNQNKELKAKVPARAEREEEVGDDPVQEAIDQVPLLVEWQHQDAEKFERAQAIDTVLAGSPKWKNKPVVERFAEAAKQVAEEYDIPYDEPKPAHKTSKNPPSTDAKTVIERATRPAPSTLSDFKGGAVPDSDKVNFEKLTPAEMLNRFSNMTDAEMDAHLAKLG